MQKQLMSLRFPSLFLIILSLVVSVSATNSIIYTNCSPFFFDSMTTYESNLKPLFTSIIDSSSISNFNKFQICPNDVPIYGLFQCQGDISLDKCKECVTYSIDKLKTSCPMSMGGTIQLDVCFVKYDNSSFFGIQNKMEVYKNCGPSVGYNSDVLNHIDEALTYLTGENEQYFRGGSFGSLQGVGQCIQDLSISDCQDCLSEACGRLRTECVTSTSADMFLGKCYLRYADQVNNGGTDNGSSSSNERASCCCCGEGNINKILMWIAIIVATFVTGIVVIIIFKIATKNEGSNVSCSLQILKWGKDGPKKQCKDKEEVKKHHPKEEKPKEEKPKPKEEKPVNECPKARPPCMYPPPYPPCYPSYPSYPSYPACPTQICVTEYPNPNACILM